MNEDPHPEERRLGRVSKDDASWFETAQVRLLTCGSGLIYTDTRQKEGPHEAGLRLIDWSTDPKAIRRSCCKTRPWRSCPGWTWHRRRRACRDIRWWISPSTRTLRRARGPYRPGSEPPR